METIATAIDLVCLIGQKSGIWLSHEARHWKDGPEYWGSCPFCGAGKDRFHAWPEATRPHYWCRFCGEQGSAPWFLVKYCKMTYPQALAELGLEELQNAKPLHGIDKDDIPCKDWLENAECLVHVAQKQLRTPRGKRALDFLYARGFTDETIDMCRLGYIPAGQNGRWIQEPLEKWGLPVTDPEKPYLTLYEGILVPWYVSDQVWKLEVRKLSVKPGDKKMPSIKGSRDCLYNINALLPGQNVALCESAFDAIAGNQQCQGLVTFLATGGTKQAQQSLWCNCLKHTNGVLVAFDNDEPGTDGKCAGDEGATFWTRNLSNAVRAYPWHHDINDMLIASMDIHAWAVNALEAYELRASAKKLPVPPVAIVQSDLVDHTVPGQDETFLLATDEPADPLYVFASTVSHIVDVLGGPEQVTITRHTPGQTLEQYMRENRPMYSPCSLLPLPRKQCGYIPCKGNALDHGWCADHVHSYDLLCLGAALGYPSVCLGYREIGVGCVQWEAYAERVSAKHAIEDLARIRIRYNYHGHLKTSLPVEQRNGQQSNLLQGNDTPVTYMASGMAYTFSDEVQL